MLGRIAADLQVLKGEVDQLQVPDAAAFAVALAPLLRDGLKPEEIGAAIAPHLGEEVATFLAERLAS
jgi:hypothetical protein